MAQSNLHLTNTSPAAATEECIASYVGKSADYFRAFAEDTDLIKVVGLVTERLVASLSRGGKLLLCGNGGSAADCQHIAAELVGRFLKEREGLPAIALTVDTSALTAIGNDYGFERVFARQVQALGSPDDLLLAVSTSGGSKNVLAAMEAAKKRSVGIIGLTGAKGGAVADGADLAICVPAKETSHVQEMHIAVGHMLCMGVDASGVTRPSQ